MMTTQTNRSEDPTTTLPKKRPSSTSRKNSDSLVFRVLLNSTVDLKTVIKHYRSKLTKTQHIVDLASTETESKSDDEDNSDDDKEDNGDESNDDAPTLPPTTTETNTNATSTTASNSPTPELTENTKLDGTKKRKPGPKKKTKEKPKNKHVLDRSNFSSMVDYMEAKYLQGVQADFSDDSDSNSNDEHKKKKTKRALSDANSLDASPDSDNNSDMSRDSDLSDAGSVYDEDDGDGFVDDSDLVKGVEEQVLASDYLNHAANDDDENEGFFVNVGELELENENGRLEQDAENDNDTEDFITVKVKSKPAASASAPKISSLTTEGEKAAITQTYQEALITNDKVFALLLASINDLSPEDLPRYLKAGEKDPRPGKDCNIHVKVPVGKKPGDTVTVKNEKAFGVGVSHKIVIPEGMSEGEMFSFMVTVNQAPPIPVNPAEPIKFSPCAKDLLVEWADQWSKYVDAASDYASIRPLDIAGGETKRVKYKKKEEQGKKFERVIREWPADTIKAFVPLAEFLVIVVRRQRQCRTNKNRQKAPKVEQQAAAQQESVEQVPIQVDDDDNEEGEGGE